MDMNNNAMGDGFAAPVPNTMGGDPNMMGGAPMDNGIGVDPGMDTGMPEDPNMMGGAPMDMGGNTNKAKEDIQKNIGKGCADFRNYQGQDKEELGKWIEGMLNSVGDEGTEAGIGDESEPPMENESMPQMETVIFTKGQLDKLNEEFGIDNLSKKDNNKKEEKTKVNNNNSPFNNPNLSKK